MNMWIYLKDQKSAQANIQIYLGQNFKKIFKYIWPQGKNMENMHPKDNILGKSEAKQQQKILANLF